MIPTQQSETPIYDTLLVEHAGAVARHLVRQGLHAKLVVCPTCHVTVGQNCVTATGKATRAHVGRRWR